MLKIASNTHAISMRLNVTFNFVMSNLRNSKYVTDSTPVVLLSVSLFLLPARIPEIFCMAEDRGNSYFNMLRFLWLKNLTIF